MLRFLHAFTALTGLTAALLGPPGAGPAGAGPAAHRSSPDGIQTIFGCKQTGAARPASTRYKLTVTGTDLAGRPESGGIAWMFNTDACDTRGEQSFRDGRATYTVPAGHYLAIGEFITGPRAHRAVRFDVLPQFTVAGSTTVHTAASSASSQLTVATPRPATLRNDVLTLIRTGRTSKIKSTLSFYALTYARLQVWVSPVSQRVTAGGLSVFTTPTLTSPPGTGVPYTYNLAFAGPPGVIPPQRFTVTAAHLAAVTERYYQDRKDAGSYAVAGGLLRNIGPNGVFVASLPMPLPGRQIQYFTAGRSAAWMLFYNGGVKTVTGGQVDTFRSFPPGTYTENWNAYPLHPVPNVNLLGPADPSELLPEASRTGNTLVVDVTPFGDSVPGHTGWGFEGNPGQVSGSYQLDQNGKRLAGGPISASGRPDFYTTAQLSPDPSVIRLTVTASRPAAAFPLSSASRDVWTWRSARQPGATVPPPWYCGTNRNGGPLRRCAVQPLLTLNYQVSHLALDGTAPPGRQTLSITAGHLQLAVQSRIARLRVAVSFNGGRTWQPATTTRTSASTFRATFTAPPGAGVTLRVTTADAAGGALTETIDNGYQTGR